MCSDTSICILIELKGRDIGQAVKQIISTLHQYRGTFKSFAKVHARIVGNFCPRILPPEYIELKKALRRLNGKVMIKENTFQEALRDL